MCESGPAVPPDFPRTARAVPSCAVPSRARGLCVEATERVCGSHRGPALAGSGRHWEPGTPDPISKAILATKPDFKTPFDKPTPGFCTEFQGESNGDSGFARSALFFSTFFQGSVPRIRVCRQKNGVARAKRAPRRSQTFEVVCGARRAPRCPLGPPGAPRGPLGPQGAPGAPWGPWALWGPGPPRCGECAKRSLHLRFGEAEAQP